MVAFSRCEYDGGEEEKHEMDIARERSWRGKFRRRHNRIIKPGANRVDGRCPLTPLEVHSYKFLSFLSWVSSFFFISLPRLCCLISFGKKLQVLEIICWLCFG